MLERNSPQMGNIMRGMRFACWLTTVTLTRTEYGIGIAFLRQQWLRECTTLLRYAYIAGLLNSCCW
jgi:hypothetical protein